MRNIVQTRCRLLWEPRLSIGSFIQRRYLKKLHPKDPNSKYDRKVEAAQEEWQKQAEAVRSGKRQSMLSILESRGFVNAIAGYVTVAKLGHPTEPNRDREELDTALTDERIGAYVGIDPTASSLHLGHLLPMMALLWMFIHGYESIALVSRILPFTESRR
jgi:hypothetical protein